MIKSSSKNHLSRQPNTRTNSDDLFVKTYFRPVFTLADFQTIFPTSSVKTANERAFNKQIYYINSSEIPGKVSRENIISSHVKITCYFLI